MKVIFTATWEIPEAIAQPWVNFIHSRWANLKARESVAIMTNSLVTGPLNRVPEIDLGIIDGQAVDGVPLDVLATCLRALTDTSLSPPPAGEAAERALVAAQIQAMLDEARPPTPPADPFTFPSGG